MLIRSLLIGICSISGYFIALKYLASYQLSIIGFLLGFIAAVIVIQIEQIIRRFSLRIILGGVIGTIIGLLIAILLSYGLRFVTVLEQQELAFLIYALMASILGYLGLVIGSKKSEEIALPAFGPFKGFRGGSDYRILDTSVIIDGRIADICDTGFIEGILVIPNFVLNELQMIADSADSIKRNRGRRGLDILNKMQKDQSIMVKISDMDFPEIHEVDAKLVKMAKVMKAMVITNDFNLNKVAEFHGVKVLNINQLSNALKPIVLPGEEMKVALIKEGKDSNQAIGYLDDGTMVVVENGRRRLGHEVDVIVTSVLQTTAGRMIFARIRED